MNQEITRRSTNDGLHAVDDTLGERSEEPDEEQRPVRLYSIIDSIPRSG